MSNANTPATMAQSMAESLFRENARLKKIEESYYRLLELDSGDVMIDTLNENDRLKEQNALLTVQVQGLRDALEDLLEQFDPRNHQSNCECDPSVGYQCAACKFPSIPAVGAAHDAITALPQQVKSEDDDTALLNAIQENSWDLVSRTLTSGGDCEIGWQVIEHHMAKPYERVIGENFQDDARAAIRAAISAQENKS